MYPAAFAAATELFASEGYGRVTTRELAKRVGISQTGLYIYFRTKEEILLAVFDYLVMLIHRRIGTPEGKPCASDLFNVALPSGSGNSQVVGSPMTAPSSCCKAAKPSRKTIA